MTRNDRLIASLRAEVARSDFFSRLWSAGDHAGGIDLYPEYRRFSPEGFFGHYLMLGGALGGRACHAKGVQLSDYENAVGTAQAHVWFEL